MYLMYTFYSEYFEMSRFYIGTISIGIDLYPLP